jgi:hypothetical protein
MAEPNANNPKPTLMSMRTGGSGTAAAEPLVPLVPLVSVVAAWSGVVTGAISEPFDRLENASDVVGKERKVRITNRQQYTKIFMVISSRKNQGTVAAIFRPQLHAILRPINKYLIFHGSISYGFYVSLISFTTHSSGIAALIHQQR